MVRLYRPTERTEVEGEIGARDRRAIGGPLWRWRYEAAPAADLEQPCIALASRPGGGFAWVSAVRTPVIVAGSSVKAAQVCGGDLARTTGDQAFDRTLFDPLLESLERSGVKVAFGAVKPEEQAHFEALGFEALTEVAIRSLYLGIGLGRRMGRSQSLSPLRRIAKEAARIRTKLFEAELNEENARRFAQSQAFRSELYSFAVEKTPEYLEWRYLRDPRAENRFLIHRPRVGLGLYGFLVLRIEESSRGRVEAFVVDHWTREPTRRSHAVLLGEVLLWAMTEQTEVLRTLAVQGSVVDQALIGMGGVRKKLSRLLMVKRLTSDVASPATLDTRMIALRYDDVELVSAVAPPPRRTSSGGTLTGA